MHNTDPSGQSRVQSEALANVIAYGMQDSPYVQLALTAQQDGEPVAARYLWRKAYTEGASQAVEWAIEHADEVVAHVLAELAQPLLETVRADEAPIEHDPVLSNPLMRRTAALIATEPEEELTRNTIAHILDTPVPSIQRIVAVLHEGNFIDEVRPSPKHSYFTPTSELQERIHNNRELTLLREFFRLRNALELKTEAQVLTFLVSLGNLLMPNPER